MTAPAPDLENELTELAIALHQVDAVVGAVAELATVLKGSDQEHGRMVALTALLERLSAEAEEAYDRTHEAFRKGKKFKLWVGEPAVELVSTKKVGRRRQVGS